jgi:tetratricopeptide (TPR) repeat protein
MPERAPAYRGLGDALEQLGRVEDAMAAYRQALALDHDDYAARYHLAVALDRTGRREEAIPEYRETIRLCPNHAGAHNNLGVLLFERAKDLPSGPERDAGLKAAEEHYCAALRADLGDAEALFNLGEVLSLTGRPAEAVVAFRQASRLNPDDAETQAGLAAALEATGAREEAADAWSRVLASGDAVLAAHAEERLRALRLSAGD